MSDDIDAAQEREQQLRDEALRVRKPVLTRCHCGEPFAILPDGKRAAYCEYHLDEWRAAQAAQLAGDWDASK